MSYDCCKAFRGWCRSFTKTERLLTVLEAIFLVVFISLLIFLILHLLACSSVEIKEIFETSSTETSTVTEVERFENSTKDGTKHHGTITKGVKNCTWTPSFKTKAVSHYYINEKDKESTLTYKLSSNSTNKLNYILHDEASAVDIDTIAKGFVLALMRVRPATYVCVVSVISAQWTVTAASCIDSIQMLRSLDRFMITHEGEKITNGHKVSDIQIHPQYQSNIDEYDLCALKSIKPLTERASFLILPTPVDMFLTLIGDRLTAFGFRKNRSAGALHAAEVRVLAVQRCERAVDGAVCAGRARGGTCGPGSPLLRGRTLLAVRGVAPVGDCAPAPYSSLAPHVQWLRSLVSSIKYLF